MTRPNNQPPSQKASGTQSRIDPSETLLRCLVLTEAAEFTLELIDILRVLTPLAARALELPCPCGNPQSAQLALNRAKQILDDSDQEQPQ